MKRIILSGCGNLGSRHLQSLATLEQRTKVLVYDPSPESLKIAEQRFNEVPKNSLVDVRYTSDLSEIKNLDEVELLISATSSKYRASNYIEIAENVKIKNVVFEKFLFPRIEDYELVENILKKQKTKAWVNFPRRIYAAYKVLREKLTPPLEFEYKGSDWGLACNNSHFFDLVVFLSQERIKSINTDKLDERIYESKRPGYVEVFGTLSAQYSNGTSATLDCVESGLEHSIKIKDSIGNYVQINELEQKCNFNDHEINFETLYQSQLTKIFAEDIFSKGSCDLPSYTEASELHTIILSSLLMFNNKVTSGSAKELMIT